MLAAGFPRCAARRRPVPGHRRKNPVTLILPGTSPPVVVGQSPRIATRGLFSFLFWLFFLLGTDGENSPHEISTAAATPMRRNRLAAHPNVAEVVERARRNE